MVTDHSDALLTFPPISAHRYRRAHCAMPRAIRCAMASGAPRVHVARAGANGVFALKLAIDVNACAGFSVTATGNQGSHATLKRAPGKCPAQ